MESTDVEQPTDIPSDSNIESSKVNRMESVDVEQSMVIQLNSNAAMYMMGRVRAKKKRKQFTIQEKWNILLELESGKRSIDVMQEYGISKNSVWDIKKNKQEIRKQIEAATVKKSDAMDRKRMRRAKHEGIEVVVYNWYQTMKSRGIHIEPGMICNKAKEVADSLGLDDFKASHGWLHRFRNRNGIVQKCDTINIAPNFPQEGASTFSQKGNDIIEILSEYLIEDIYVASETTLFYDFMPKDTMVAKAISHVRKVTLLLCCNGNGYDKLSPLIVGRYKDPWCMETNDSLPCVYRYYGSSKMTRQIFVEWLLELNRRIASEDRNIALLTDNHFAHKSLPVTSNVKVLYFPSSSISFVHSLCQDIIHVLKFKYRYRMLQVIMEQFKLNKEPKINLYEAIIMIAVAWMNVSESFIRHSWQKSGVLLHYYQSEQCDDDVEIKELPDTDLWEEVQTKMNVTLNISFDDFVAVDDDIIMPSEQLNAGTSGPEHLYKSEKKLTKYKANRKESQHNLGTTEMDIEKIADQSNYTDVEQPEEYSIEFCEEENETSEWCDQEVTSKDALKNVDDLRRYFSAFENAPENIFATLDDVEDFILANKEDSN